MSTGDEQLIAAQLRDHVRGEVTQLADADRELVESLACAIRGTVLAGESRTAGLGQLALALASVDIQAAPRASEQTSGRHA